MQSKKLEIEYGNESLKLILVKILKEEFMKIFNQER